MILWVGLSAPVVRLDRTEENLHFGFFLSLLRGLDEFLQVDFLLLGHISSEN